MIRRADSQLDLLSPTERRPNTAQETRLCRRFRLENRLPEDIKTVSELDAYSDLGDGRYRKFITPDRCKRTIPDDKKATAEYCGRYCRQVIWDLEHPRLGTSEEDRFRETHPEPEAEAPSPPAGDGEKPTIDERFEAWLEANPVAYRKAQQFALEALDACRRSGRRERCGIDLIVGRLRWYHHVERISSDPFKINNDFRSRLSRKLMEDDPRLAGFFETRELKTK